MTRLFVVKIGDALMDTYPTRLAAAETIRSPQARIELRGGIHPRWTDRAWWRDFAMRHGL